MKKILLFTLCLLLLSNLAKAAENNLDISFSEFCPFKRFQNIDTSKDYILDSKIYWASRKKTFDKYKAICMSKDTDEKKAECIDKLRSLQRELTAQRYNQMTKSRIDDAPTEDGLSGVVQF